MSELSGPPVPPELPTGTVTFLFTDLQASTRVLEAHPEAYRVAVGRHHALLRAAVEGHGGVVFETLGDAVCAAFARPADAAAAALAGQRALEAAPWGATGPLRARMALHTGEAEVQGRHYFGVPLYRCGRILALAAGGQVLLSSATRAGLGDALPLGATLRDVGEQPLRGWTQTERVYQLEAGGPPAAPVEMRVVAVRVQTFGGPRTVVLRAAAAAADRTLTLYIAQPDADAIAVALEGGRLPRPLTHDLLCSAFAALGARVRHVRVEHLVRQTFHARIVLDAIGGPVELDARASDALAVAVRLGVPILVDEAVLRLHVLAPTLEGRPQLEGRPSPSPGGGQPQRPM